MAISSARSLMRVGYILGFRVIFGVADPNLRRRDQASLLLRVKLRFSVVSIHLSFRLLLLTFFY